ncbi:hypothetical protein DW955_03160 [Ruminococcus sp. AM45-9BH]|nr:hypothetical protein DW955_03160 [Ruminococcus sp. AM45-9BH]
MHKKLVFLFIGRTASGKSSLARYICETLRLRQVKSITTRLPRKDEITGYEDHTLYLRVNSMKLNLKKAL